MTIHHDFNICPDPSGLPSLLFYLNTIFMERYNFHLWSGCGYFLDTFVASGYCFEDAIDNFVCDLITQNKAAYFITCEEMDRLKAENGLDDDQDLEGYIYIDATMSGAPYPVYLLVENMKFDRLP